ncbi:hypothetical protein N7495_005740 [Penicillium taxi]|uniref:uncharacterized protein n=1 Tax=Penicillium taxi TaxID=168475 RepID=UPI002544FC14|nr:uncharacterized protein N7495_005740 [Penicillium taxi]KAJ5894049.1 hypothetical protein N7495_005740 [Penicillium taxi]
MLRKTRFVCVSDTHGYTPSEAGFKLPAGDVLIHAGDLTKNGSTAELRKTMAWISEANFEIKIIVAGNHDITLDPEFYAKHGQSFHSRLEDPQQCIDIVSGSSPSVVYLQHQAAIIRLIRPDGPNTMFKVFGSPYSQSEGNWAFGLDSKDTNALWNQIPLDVDILVTHTPPQSHCDQKPTGMLVGCNALRQTLRRIRPLLSVCGHVHEGRGYERVRWRSLVATENGGVDDDDITTPGFLPPLGSKKQSLVDLTGKSIPSLDNTGFSGSAVAQCDFLEMSPMSPPSSIGQPAAFSILKSIVPTVNAGSHVVDHGCAAQTLRRETCIVNAAIMATSWPHRGGKRFHAPIVVDVHLPVRQEGDPKR